MLFTIKGMVEMVLVPSRNLKVEISGTRFILTRGECNTLKI